VCGSSQQRTEFGKPIDMKFDPGLVIFVEREKPVGDLRLQLDFTPRHSAHDISENLCEVTGIGVEFRPSTDNESHRDECVARSGEQIFQALDDSDRRVAACGQPRLRAFQVAAVDH
jgi:hypothetical protein